MPPLNDSINCGKWAPLNEVICRITKDTLTYLANPDLVQKIRDQVEILLSAGFDGSGRHNQFRSMRTGSENIIFGGVRLIEIRTKIDSMVEMIYLENSMGPDTEFPWFLSTFHLQLFFL